MATYQEQIEAAKKKNADKVNATRTWLLSGIADGVAPLVADGVLTKEQGEKVIRDILKSLSSTKL